MKYKVKTFFDDYAEALLTYSAEKISGFYQAPMAVYSDQGVQAVTKNEEIIAFWQQGVKPYQKMNIEKSVPTILEEQQLSKTVCIAKVLWTNTDKNGKEVGKETNFYILSAGNFGFKITGLIIMAEV